MTTRTLFASLTLLVGCNADSADPSTGPFEDEGANAHLETLVAGIVDPTAARTPLVCPDIEDGTYGEFTCTSTMNGNDVSWTLSIVNNETSDAAMFNLLPDYGSPPDNAEQALLKAFRDDFGVVMSSATCQPADENSDVIPCQVTLDDLSFGSEFTGTGGEAFGYTFPGVTFKRQVETLIAEGLVGDDGPRAVVTCDAPPVFEDVPGFEVMCQAHAPETGERATVRYLIGDDPAQFRWDIVPPSGS